MMKQNKNVAHTDAGSFKEEGRKIPEGQPNS